MLFTRMAKTVHRKAARSSPLYAQVRGKAVQNWKRPSLDEMGVPTESWTMVNATRQVRYNAQLASGVAFFGFTLAFAHYNDLIELRGTPPCAYSTGYSVKNSAAAVDKKLKEPLLLEKPVSVEEISHSDTHVKKEAKPLEVSPNGLPDEVPYLLIGGGTASFAAYRAIKARDPRAKILIISSENRTPYMRPPLSKELWYSEKKTATGNELKFQQWNGRERNLYYEPEQFYGDPATLSSNEKGGIAVVKGRQVTKLDPDNQVATLDDGRRIKYGKCLIATGGRPKSLECLDKFKDNVTLFRNVDDYYKLDNLTQSGKLNSVTVIGGGFLGSELTCALGARGKKAGFTVTQVFPEQGHLFKILPAYLSKWATARVRKEGITVIPETSIKSATMKKGQVQMTTTDGRVLTTDHVVVAVGMEPNTALADSSGLEVDQHIGGFAVNSELEASRRNIYVAGDAASFYDVKLGRRRVEHHDHAIVSGRLAGENMVGGRKPYENESMLWSDLGQEIGFEAVGRVDSQLTSVGVFAKSPDATVTSAKPDNYEKGVVFYTDKSEVVVGVLMWNIFNHMSLARKVIRESKKFDDLTEVAKLFELYDKPDEEAKEESKKEVAN